MFKRRITRGIAALDLCLVLSLCAATYVRYNEYQHRQRYQVAVGKITRSELVASTDQHSGRLKTTYRAAIAYEYSVDGRQFQGARIRWMELFQERASRAKADVQRYRRGSLVPVHYDPDRPGQAFLELDYTGAFIALASALAAVSVGLSLLSTALSRGKRRPRP